MGCAVEQGKIYTKDGKQYGVTSSHIWRGEWWNYYQRGTSYAEGEYWPDAIAHFQEAIKQRETDQRRARTYGLHFIDYFPHRELGIAYYQLERYPEAIRELETSLRNYDSSKAKFYLNKARQAVFRQTKRDAVAPQIRLDGALDGLLTNRLTLQVTGQADAEAYVSAISINGDPLFIELAEPHVAFAEEVALQDGPNPIEIVAVDLLGQRTRHLVTIHVDRQGPLLSLDTDVLSSEPTQRRVRVQGLLSDRSPLVRFLLAGKRMPVPAKPEWEFREEVTLMDGMAAIPFEAEDAAGNVTRGEITPLLISNGQPGIRKGESEHPLLTRWAFLTSSPVVPDSPMFRAVPRWTAQGSDQTPPIISLTDQVVQHVVFNDAIFLEGKIISFRATQAFSINGAPFAFRGRQQSFFSQLVPLQLGENRFLLEAVDDAGSMGKEEIVVTRRAVPIRELDRLQIFLFFWPKSDQSTARIETIYGSLGSALRHQRRFQFVERQAQGFEAILREIKLSQSEVVDKATALKIGRVTAAEGILIGGFNETAQELEVVLRLVDAETAVEVTEADIYGQDQSFQGISELMRNVAMKLKQRFPLVEGVVKETKGKQVILNFGVKHLIKRNMKVILFREGGTSKRPGTGKDPGFLKRLGEARIEVVSEDSSQAILLPPAKPAAVKQGDRAITK